ncbi:ASPIC and UnbV [Planctomycetes bacterium MalM25]|nr:ASPIC and UnbV [Planctomycetes bacterium MalM25]
MDEPELLDEQPLDEQNDDLIGRALQRSLVAFLVLGLLVAGGAWLLRRVEPEQVDEVQVVALPEVREAPVATMPRLVFTDITGAAGIDFVHCNGATGEKLLPETMGGGCAFFDYDNDGDQDLLLVNSCAWPWDEGQPPATSALYANNGEGVFTDVTEEAGLDQQLYGMGVAVGDYDNDGHTDLFVSAVGKNRLFRNVAGVFAEVTTEAGVAGSAEAWSTSCGWLDYDNDGDLDLLVGNYVSWSREIDQVQDFRLTGIGRAYGPPFSFEGSYPYLYRNNGDGAFDDVSAVSGVQQRNLVTEVPLAKTLGISPVDANGDGWIDFVLANDTVRNLLFLNQKDGTFVESGIEAGLAFDASGKARGAMGIDSARFRNDDALGVAIANFANEMTALYVSYGDNATFTDDAIPTGLGPPTRGDLSFGLFFFDADLDGRLDLLAANGHLEDDIQVVQTSQHYRQPAALFWNAGDAGAEEFARVPSDKIGSDLAKPLVGRGAAYADIDGDGDLDVLITQIAGPPALLRNDQETGHHWLRFKLIGATANRDAIGATVEVTRGESKLVRTVMPTRSYLSQVEALVTIGLGGSADVDRVVVRWPGGAEQEVTDFQADATTIVTQRE